MDGETGCYCTNCLAAIDPDDRTPAHCECCNSRPCRCDLDERNPVDMTADEWREFYATHPDFDIGDDHSMDY